MTHATARRAIDLRHRLAAVLGLGPAALGGLGCGAIAVFVDDGAEGEGGAGGSTSATTSRSGSTAVGTTGSTPFTCHVPTAEYACASIVGPCPPADSPQAWEIMNEVLAGPIDCGSRCYCHKSVQTVPCGPDPNAAECCYYVVTYIDEICMGRPFTAAGRALVAALEPRGDWSRHVDVRAQALSLDVRRVLADGWAQDGRYEHASIASFARFTLDLLAIGAPAELVRRAQEAMRDEIRHAELCFGVASALADEPIGPGPLPTEGALDGRDRIAVLEAVVREGCVGETIAALLAGAARDQASDAGVIEALEQIARDEARHAELAWSTVAWALGAAGPDRDAMAIALGRAFDAAAPSPEVAVHPTPAAVPPAAARAFGRLAGGERARIAAAAFDQVVRPLARALLEGGPSSGVVEAALPALNTKR